MHSLESGLAIYEVKLLAGDPLITAAIAGPHHSFNTMLEKIGNTSTMLAAFTQGLAQWERSGPPPIQSMHLDTRDLEMAAALNIAEIRGLDDISEFNNNNTLPTARICAEHISPLAEECLQHQTQKATHKDRGQLLTDTRGDILYSYDADDEQVTRTCCETNKAKAYQHRSNNTTTPCRSICCNGCQHTSCHQPIELNEQEYLELSADVLEAEDAKKNHINLEITAHSYKVSINQLEEELGPDISIMKAREQSMESMVHIEYRCPKCRNCQDCREAHETERISLKEEAEDGLIRDSLTLDY